MSLRRYLKINETSEQRFQKVLANYGQSGKSDETILLKFELLCLLMTGVKYQLTWEDMQKFFTQKDFNGLDTFLQTMETKTDPILTSNC